MNKMQEKSQDSDSFQLGDKVRVRTGSYAKTRGVIQGMLDGLLAVQLDDSSIIHIASNDITNYSLAARRAWQTMPKRAGRPRLPVPRKQMVSIRIDVDTWNRLGEAVELGLVPSREEAVNAWLREHLDLLLDGKPPQI